MPGGCEESHICAVWSALLLRLAGRFCLRSLACFFTAFFGNGFDYGETAGTG